MKTTRLLIFLTALLLAVGARAQSSVDSTLLGVDVFSLINEKGSGSVTVNQSIEIRNTS